MEKRRNCSSAVSPELKRARRFSGQLQVKPPRPHPGAGAESLPVVVAAGRDMRRSAGFPQSGQGAGALVVRWIFSKVLPQAGQAYS